MICEGFQHRSAYFSQVEQRVLLAEVMAIIDAAPLFQPRMPGTGRPFSVKMTNAGALGWVSDKNGGYRYQDAHPLSGKAWPAIPDGLIELWREVSDCSLLPEACLVNVYREGAKMGSHRDQDEDFMSAPVVSVSLGDTARFHIGGHRRSDSKQRLDLKSGDVVVLGGPARLAYHGVDRIKTGTSDLIDGGGRINLTLRRVTRPEP